MRLINADKITFFDCLAKTGNSICCHAKGIISKEGIDEQPTVEAIPAEWIKDYALSQWNTTSSEYHAITEMVKAWIYDDDYTGYARIYEEEDDRREP